MYATQFKLNITGRHVTNQAFKKCIYSNQLWGAVFIHLAESEKIQYLPQESFLQQDVCIRKVQICTIFGSTPPI